MESGRLRTAATSSQAWALIQRGFAPRLTLLTSGRKDERRTAVAQLEAESARRGSAGYYLSARVDLEIEHLDNYATQLYEACSEVAEVEGLARNRAFNNAVFEHCITQAFAGRRSGLEGELLLRDQRTNRAGCSKSAIAAFSQRVNQLHSEWRSKLEIESLNFEAKERVERELAARRLPIPLVDTFRTHLPPSPLSVMTPSKKRAKKKLTNAEKQRRAAIFAAIQSNLEGLKYCKELDRRRLSIPTEWMSDGCPNSYSTAYKSGSESRWRQRIQDEKYRYGKKYKRASPTQRESLIQQVPSARPTRQ